MKVRLKMRLMGQEISPKEVPWEALIWVGSKQMGIKGGWDGEKATGYAQVEEDYAVISADSPQLGSGEMKCEVVMSYPDSVQEDGSRRVTIPVVLTMEEEEGETISGWVDHTIRGERGPQGERGESGVCVFSIEDGDLYVTKSDGNDTEFAIEGNDLYMYI
ncbi:MAG: hypothetical protein KBT03_09905 [Bacteroidales bacterium]|nr:hypothetical protein [Candidatus Scybalousia scybalohippi]